MILKIPSFFTRFVIEEENHILMEEVSKEELKVGIASFKRDKSLGQDGWLVEFF
jgi:hypothetical protein